MASRHLDRLGGSVEQWQKVMNEMVSALEETGISYQLAGTAAALYYGSEELVASLDFEMPDNQIERAAMALCAKGAKVARPMGPYVDEAWQLNMATLYANGQKINLTGSNFARIFDVKNDKWVNLPTDPARAEWRRFGQRLVRMIPREDLVKCQELGRRN